MTFKSIGIIGVGGVGGFFGGKLCGSQNAERRVYFVARNEHLRAIQRQAGLLLKSDDGTALVCRPFLATDDYEQLPPLDLCLLCVKAFDLPDALSRLRPVINESTVVLPLLNGVDVHSRVKAVIQGGIVLQACVYVGTHIEAPGVVRQKGGACKILFGPDPEWRNVDPDPILSLFTEAAIKAEWLSSEAVQAEIWKKFIFIAAYGLVSAAYDKTLGEILENEILGNEVKGIMSEASALARAGRVPLPDDIIDVSFAKAHSFPPEAKTSFQRDFERAEKRDERDLFAGAMIRIGKELGVDVPRTRIVADLLAKRKPLPRPG